MGRRRARVEPVEEEDPEKETRGSQAGGGNGRRPPRFQGEAVASCDRCCREGATGFNREKVIAGPVRALSEEHWRRSLTIVGSREPVMRRIEDGDQRQLFQGVLLLMEAEKQ